MDLRELKKEVDNLADVAIHTTKFKECWIKPIRANTNSHLPFLHTLTKDTCSHINERLAGLRPHLDGLQKGTAVQEKLHHYSRYLIELKLAELRNHEHKTAHILRTIRADEALKLSTTITQAQEFDQHIKHIAEQYEEINLLLQKDLSLEETLFFQDLPHKIHLYNLQKVSHDHLRIIRNISRHLHKIGDKQSLKNAKR